MTINKYIEQYSVIETNNLEVTITLCVPAKESVILADDEYNATKQVRIFTQDIENYLKHKGLSINKVLQTCSVDNALLINEDHPNPNKQKNRGVGCHIFPIRN